MQNIDIKFPYDLKINIPDIFNENIDLKLYSQLTIFIGPNGTGKTQTLKKIRTNLKEKFGLNVVRYLSSNRIGTMEPYRSKADKWSTSERPNDFYIGDETDKKNRKIIETSIGDFFAMDEKKDIFIKVAERLSVFYKRKIYIHWDAGNMQIFFERKNSKSSYSVTLEASGLINFISILAALYDEDIKFLLIDEPEVSLHPQLQAYMLEEIKYSIKNYGKIIIISTHSANMLSFNSINDFSNLVFFTEEKVPIQIEPNNDILKNVKFNTFFLNIGEIYKNGFFAKTVLLVEGITDFKLCQFLANKLNINIAGVGAQIIPVEGKSQFLTAIKLFKLIEKKCVILTDLDSFIDNNEIINIFANTTEGKKIAANNLAAKDFNTVATDIKTTLRNLIDKNTEMMKSFSKEHSYYPNDNEPSVDQLKRAVVGQLFCVDSNTLNDFPELNTLKIRLSTFFNSLKEMGCFILTKGSIENYYYSNKVNDKTQKNLDEISFLVERDNDFIKKNYSEFIELLDYIANVDSIDESLAIRKELLSELAVILEILQNDTTENDIITEIKQIKNSSISLFKYNILKEDKLGLEISLKSNIMNVSGFPLKIFKGENVNKIVEKNIINNI